MKLRRISILLLAAATLAGQPVGVIRMRPLLSPENAATLESDVLQNPEDINARIQLLQFYLDSYVPIAFASRATLRLQHILYLVEHHPELAASASRVAYVYRANGPYASPADHDAVRGEWLAAVQAHPKNVAVAINAATFLQREDQLDAEEVLHRAISNEPADRELPANLGFLYAKELLSPDLAAHAKGELEQTSNAIVLAAAGTALPNLAKSRIGLDPQIAKLFDVAAKLSARARQLAPGDADIQGPMPLIKYFAAAQGDIPR
jgi:hypothetical protein